MRSLGDNLRPWLQQSCRNVLEQGMLRESFRYAVVGTFDRANAITSTIGTALVYLAMLGFGWKVANPTDLDGIITLLATLLVPWATFIIARFIYWPWRELKLLHRTSPLEVFVDPNNGSFREWDKNPNHTPYEDDAFGEFYLAEVVNHGTQTIEGVRVVYSYDGQTNHHFAFGTDKTKLNLDPNSRKLVKLFFQSLYDYTGNGDFEDPSPRDITVRATARDTTSSPPLRLHFEPNGADRYSDKPIYAVTVKGGK